MLTKPKGLPKTGGRTKGSKNKSTLKREELRQIFKDRMIDEWDMLLRAQIKDARKDYRSRHYIFDQIIGKAIESMELSGKDGEPLNIGVTIQKALDKFYGAKQ